VHADRARGSGGADALPCALNAVAPPNQAGHISLAERLDDSRVVQLGLERRGVEEGEWGPRARMPGVQIAARAYDDRSTDDPRATARALRIVTREDPCLRPAFVLVNALRIE
jgi:hypothetical protein